MAAPPGYPGIPTARCAVSGVHIQQTKQAKVIRQEKSLPTEVRAARADQVSLHPNIACAQNAIKTLACPSILCQVLLEPIRRWRPGTATVYHVAEALALA